MPANPLRNIPSVNELLESPPLKRLVDRISRNTLVATIGKALDEMRQEVQTAASERTIPHLADLAERIARRVLETQGATLRPLVNASGVLLDPRLGEAPLAEDAIDELAAVARDYTNLELDLASGQRSRRDPALESLLRELTGAEAALAVNHHAGAAMLTLAALAGPQAKVREVVVARSQSIETDSYRLPEAIAASGAVLREVGTTNKTSVDDYARAIGPQTAALLAVHVSNFAVVGSASNASLEELVALGRRHNVLMIHDLGAGTLVDLAALGIKTEAIARRSLQAGADLVLLAGDKLLGGPQCGIVAGQRNLIDALERHPLGRALQAGKLTSAALAATLRLYRDLEKARLAIPILHLLTTSAENLKNRAERLAPQIAAAAVVREAEVVADVTYIEGYAVPDRQLPTWCIAVRPATGSVERLARALRMGMPSVIGRQESDQLRLDLRSVLPRQDLQLVAAIESLEVGEGY